MLKGRIDLRSDTLTEPTDEMLEAMRHAEIGDDVIDGDPTVKRLESMAAAMLGKEAGLLVVSGTMGNLVSILAHTQHGQEVILESDSHIFWYEVGGLSSVGGLMCRRIPGKMGALDPADVEDAIRTENIHFPETGLICLENTHNMAGGTISSPRQMAAVKKVAALHGIPVHLDGARLFNASVGLGVEAKEIASHADSVTFCLSKGLSCPVGAVVVGDTEFIARARKKRKLLGGGMRQAGIIAAAGIVALETMIGRLAHDHRRARLLADRLAKLEGAQVDLRSVQTNMVRLNVSRLNITGEKFAEQLARHNVYALPQQKNVLRFVTHRHITDADIEAAAAAVQMVITESC